MRCKLFLHYSLHRNVSCGAVSDHFSVKCDVVVYEFQTELTSNPDTFIKCCKKFSKG